MEEKKRDKLKKHGVISGSRGVKKGEDRGKSGGKQTEGK